MTNPEGPTALQFFLDELERLQGCERTKERVRAIMRRMIGQRVFFTRRDLLRPELRRMARALLDDGYSASQARTEMVVRGRFSRDTAERLITAALTERALAGIAARQMVLDLAVPKEAGDARDRLAARHAEQPIAPSYPASCAMGSLKNQG